MNIHFISGLPRSGSTLLAAMLRQNKNFHASIQSPLGNIYTNTFAAMGVDNESVDFISETQRTDILRGLFETYYEDTGHEKTIFDTNRLWTARFHELFELFPDARMLVLVRPVAEILNSFERIYRANPLLCSRMFGAGSNSVSRCNRLTGDNGVVSVSLVNTKDAFFNGPKDRIMFLRYSTLVQQAKFIMPVLYNFFGIDTGNEAANDPREIHSGPLEQIPGAQEFDERMGLKGLHTIKTKIEPQSTDMLIPPEIIQQFSQLPFWENQTMNRHGLVIL